MTIINLTGVAVATQIGSLQPQVSVLLTGIALTASLNAPRPAISKTPSGRSATSAIGTFTPKLTPANIFRGGLGQVATSQISGFPASFHPAGVEAFAVSSPFGLVPKIPKILVGRVVTSAIGALLPAPHTINLTSLVVTSSAGHLPVRGVITGQNATARIGTFGVRLFSGVSVTAAIGSLTIYVQLNGLHVTPAVGVPQPQKITGNVAHAQIGNFPRIPQFQGQRVTALVPSLAFNVRTRGVSATSLVGTFRSPINLTQLTPSVIATALVGRFRTAPLLGNQAITQVGTFRRPTSTQPSLIGVSSNAQSGTFALQIVSATQILQLKLIGVQVSASVGTGSPLRQKTITGTTATALPGRFVRGSAFGIFGVSATTAVGTITRRPLVIGNFATAQFGVFRRILHGVSVTATASSFKPRAFSGLSVTATQGLLFAGVRLVGQHISAGIGAIRLAKATALSGVVATTNIGHFLPAKTRALVGQFATTAVGLVRGRTGRIIGLERTVQIGVFVPKLQKTPSLFATAGLGRFAFTRTMVGNQATSHFGVIKALHQQALSGVGGTAGLGSVVGAVTKTFNQQVIAHQGGLGRRVSFSGVFSTTVGGILLAGPRKILRGQFATAEGATTLARIKGRPLIGQFATFGVGHFTQTIQVRGGLAATVALGTMTVQARSLTRVLLVGLSSTARLGHLGVLPPIHGVVATTIIGHFTSTKPLQISGVHAQAMFAGFSPQIGPLLTGLTIQAAAGTIRKIFAGVFVTARAGTLLPVVTYPPHPVRKLPPYELRSVHDLFTGRHDNSDPTGSFDERLPDVPRFVYGR